MEVCNGASQKVRTFFENGRIGGTAFPSKLKDLLPRLSGKPPRAPRLSRTGIFL